MAVFVTIDDREIAHLKILSWTRFLGDENCISLVAWEKVFAKKNEALVSGSIHDHVLIYAKSIEYWSRNLLPRSESQLAGIQQSRYRTRAAHGRRCVLFCFLGRCRTKKGVSIRDYFAIWSGTVRPVPTGRHWNGLEVRHEELRNDHRQFLSGSDADGDSLPRENASW